MKNPGDILALIGWVWLAFGAVWLIITGISSHNADKRKDKE